MVASGNDAKFHVNSVKRKMVMEISLLLYKFLHSYNKYYLTSFCFVALGRPFTAVVTSQEHSSSQGELEGQYVNIHVLKVHISEDELFKDTNTKTDEGRVKERTLSCRSILSIKSEN